MREHKHGERIGGTSSKQVFDSADTPAVVSAEFHAPLTNNQIKSAYYLGKISHLLFPKNIPDIFAAFNDKGGTSKLLIQKGRVDKEHIGHNQLLAMLMNPRVFNSPVDPQKRKAMAEYFRRNEQDDDISKFRAEANTKGLNLDYGGQNFARDPEGNVLYLETNPAWEIRGTGNESHIIYYVDMNKLRDAIIALNELERSKAILYYQRLEKLMPK